MTLNFKTGFTYKGLDFGWFKKELYRLPSEKSGKTYQLKKLELIEVGNKKGYRVCRDKKSVDQLLSFGKEINIKIKIIGLDDNNCPY